MICYLPNRKEETSCDDNNTPKILLDTNYDAKTFILSTCFNSKSAPIQYQYILSILQK